jgi:hypothetical protein
MAEVLQTPTLAKSPEKLLTEVTQRRNFSGI